MYVCVCMYACMYVMTMVMVMVMTLLIGFDMLSFEESHGTNPLPPPLDLAFSQNKAKVSLVSPLGMSLLKLKHWQSLL